MKSLQDKLKGVIFHPDSTILHPSLMTKKNRYVNRVLIPKFRSKTKCLLFSIRQNNITFNFILYNHETSRFRERGY